MARGFPGFLRFPLVASPRLVEPVVKRHDDSAADDRDEGSCDIRAEGPPTTGLLIPFLLQVFFPLTEALDVFPEEREVLIDGGDRHYQRLEIHEHEELLFNNDDLCVVSLSGLL